MRLFFFFAYPQTPSKPEAVKKSKKSGKVKSKIVSSDDDGDDDDENEDDNKDVIKISKLSFHNLVISNNK